LVSEVALIHQYDPNEREARERVQARLALISLIIWFVASFGAAALLVPRYGVRAPLVLAIGFGALLVAALPWLAYSRLVEADLQARRRPPS
jgi:hypothetical protein